MRNQKPSLDDFVVKAKAKRCAVCRSALREQIESGRERGISIKLIAEWANSVGETSVTRGGIRYHFDEGHTNT